MQTLYINLQHMTNSQLAFTFSEGSQCLWASNIIYPELTLAASLPHNVANVSNASSSSLLWLQVNVCVCAECGYTVVHSSGYIPVHSVRGYIQPYFHCLCQNTAKANWFYELALV